MAVPVPYCEPDDVLAYVNLRTPDGTAPVEKFLDQDLDADPPVRATDPSLARVNKMIAWAQTYLDDACQTTWGLEQIIEEHPIGTPVIYLNYGHVRTLETCEGDYIWGFRNGQWEDIGVNEYQIDYFRGRIRILANHYEAIQIKYRYGQKQRPKSLAPTTAKIVARDILNSAQGVMRFGADDGNTLKDWAKRIDYDVQTFVSAHKEWRP